MILMASGDAFRPCVDIVYFWALYSSAFFMIEGIFYSEGYWLALNSDRWMLGLGAPWPLESGAFGDTF